jgi:serine/threonine protein kinase
MSETDASWPTTTPGARVAVAPDRVPVHDALNPGTRLDEFEIVRVLGTGGFGIVYLARDHVLLREVAIKEYMPAALAGRGDGAAVTLRSPGFADLFARGLESFLSEARLLASFDHRSLVKVHRFWRSNATAYMAMQYYCGETLKDARSRMSAAPDEVWLDGFIEALLGVLDLLHGEGVYHRDISPDNILLLEDGRPVLLDLGSARRVMADSPQSFTAHLKPQFAPIEQYADEAGGMRQGPWTDLYALGATLYFLLTGRAPTPSVVRAVRDVLPPLVAQAGSTMPRVRASLLAVIDWTLALAPEQRPQNVLAMRRALSGEVPAPPPSPRQLGAPAGAVAPNCTDAVDSNTPPSDAHRGRPARRWFSRLTTNFWGAAAEPDAKPSRLRRRAHISAALSLAFMGVVALAWGAWTFNRPSLATARPSAATVGSAPAIRVATSDAVAVPAPSSTAAPAPSATESSAPPSATLPATAPTDLVREPTPDPPPAPARAPLNNSNADPVAMWVKPDGQQASAAASRTTPPAVSPAPRRASGSAAVAPSAAKSAPRERQRAARPKAPATSVATRSPHPAQSGCDASGLLARAWCAMNPCKASHSRANPECMERLRAEAARQQRVERQ